MTTDNLLVLLGVSSRYLVGLGQVQEAVFMNQTTGQEFVLGLVDGQFEALLAILKENDGDTGSGEEAPQSVSARQAVGNGGRVIPPNTEYDSEYVQDEYAENPQAEQPWAEEEDAEADEVAEAGEHEVRALFSRGF